MIEGRTAAWPGGYSRGVGAELGKDLFSGTRLPRASGAMALANFGEANIQAPIDTSRRTTERHLPTETEIPPTNMVA